MAGSYTKTTPVRPLRNYSKYFVKDMKEQYDSSIPSAGRSQCTTSSRGRKEVLPYSCSSMTNGTVGDTVWLGSERANSSRLDFWAALEIYARLGSASDNSAHIDWGGGSHCVHIVSIPLVKSHMNAQWHQKSLSLFMISSPYAHQCCMKFLISCNIKRRIGFPYMMTSPRASSRRWCANPMLGC